MAQSAGAGDLLPADHPAVRDLARLDGDREHHRQPAAPQHRLRLQFPRQHRRLFHQLLPGRLFRGAQLRPRPAGRLSQHRAVRRPGHRLRHRHRLHRRHRPPLPQLDHRPPGHRLCGDRPQHPPAAADLLLVYRRFARPAGAARFPRTAAQCAGQHPRHGDSQAAAARRLRRRGGRLCPGLHRLLLPAPLGAPPPAADRPAVPGVLEQPRHDPAAAPARLLRHGTAHRLGISRAQGLQLRRRLHPGAGTGRPGAGPVHLHRLLHRRDRPRRHPGRQPRTDRGLPLAWPAPRTISASGHHSPGHARHHPAADQPISQPDQEFLPRRRHRLSRTGLGVRRHRPQPDRTGRRSAVHRAGHLPVLEHHHLPVHELV